jgi:hypothetical protein
MAIKIRGTAYNLATAIVDRDLIAVARLASYTTDGGSLGQLTQDAAMVLSRLFPSLPKGLITADFIGLNTTELFAISEGLKRELYADAAYAQSIDAAMDSEYVAGNPDAAQAITALRADIQAQSAEQPAGLQAEIEQLRAKLAAVSAV